MHAILGFGQLLEAEQHLAADARESVAQILQAGRRLLIMIDALLDLARADVAGKAESHADMELRLPPPPPAARDPIVPAGKSAPSSRSP